MSFSSFRSPQSALLHAVVWLLLAVLIFTQPGHELSAARHYGLQGGLYAVSLGLFYLNVNWAVPQLLYRHRLPAYLALVLAAVLAVTLAHGAVRQSLQSLPAAVGPGAPQLRLPQPGPPQPGPPLGPPVGGGGPPVPGGLGPQWLNPAVILSTLLVVGVGTSVAAVLRGQQDARIRHELEQEKLSTELSWLKAQLNPHFFFNTLNNIYALTLLDGGQARTAIHRLSRMMRYVLYDTQAGAAPLSQEVQFLQDYIELMQLRLTDNVRVEFSTPLPLHDAPIAPMLLLTFVENAFKHGVSTVQPSSVRIGLRQPTPHTLELTVHNSVFAERPAALDENTGIGLPNTRRRLELLYPGRHTLEITPLTPAHEYAVHLTLTLLP